MKLHLIFFLFFLFTTILSAQSRWHFQVHGGIFQEFASSTTILSENVGSGARIDELNSLRFNMDVENTHHFEPNLGWQIGGTARYVFHEKWRLETGLSVLTYQFRHYEESQYFLPTNFQLIILDEPSTFVGCHEHIIIGDIRGADYDDHYTDWSVQIPLGISYELHPKVRLSGGIALQFVAQRRWQTNRFSHPVDRSDPSRLICTSRVDAIDELQVRMFASQSPVYPSSMEYSIFTGVETQLYRNCWLRLRYFQNNSRRNLYSIYYLQRQRTGRIDAELVYEF